MQRLAFLSLALLLSACSHTGDALRGAGAGATSPDAQLMRDIAQANIAEIETGRLAVDKAQADDVRGFAQRMVDEHSRMQAEAGRLADAKGMPLPERPGPMHQAAAKKLDEVAGAEFDRAYMQQMVKDHAAALELLERVLGEARDADVRALAQDAIPQVRRHLDAARRIAGDVVGLRQ